MINSVEKLNQLLKMVHGSLSNAPNQCMVERLDSLQVKKTYLSINGFEAYTGVAGSSTTTTTSTGGSSVNVKLEKNRGMVKGTAK
jgi:hypothetical protein